MPTVPTRPVWRSAAARIRSRPTCTRSLRRIWVTTRTTITSISDRSYWAWRARARHSPKSGAARNRRRRFHLARKAKDVSSASSGPAAGLTDPELQKAAQALRENRPQLAEAVLRKYLEADPDD